MAYFCSVQVQFLLSLELFSMVEQKVKVQYSVDHVSYLLLTVVQHYTHNRSAGLNMYCVILRFNLALA